MGGVARELVTMPPVSEAEPLVGGQKAKPVSS